MTDEWQTRIHFYQCLVSSMQNCELEHFTDAFSSGQIQSKIWLIKEAQKVLGNNWGVVFVLGGWIGVLPFLLLQHPEIKVKKLRSFDLDPKMEFIADTLNKDWVKQEWLFKAITADILNLDYEVTRYVGKKHDGTYSKQCSDLPDLIINLICEHLVDFPGWLEKLPKGKLVILQSNDFTEGKGHVNCSDNLDNFVAKAKLTSVLFAGEYKLNSYTRFMVIGRV